MKLIDRIEIRYFRSLYKAETINVGDLNVIFGRNDSGKSNILRALNLFFNGHTSAKDAFDFSVDFSDLRKGEARQANKKQFIIVRLDFNVPPNYRRSLGTKISVKRQWNRDGGMTESLPAGLSRGKQIQAAKFLNQIDFTYVPAIKDIEVFSDLIEKMFSVAVRSKRLQQETDNFINGLRAETADLAANLSELFRSKTQLAQPTEMARLFRALDFTLGDEDEGTSHSLLKQKGDGIKARHIPELIRYINENDPTKKFHVWGFEEPENSLDFHAAEQEARRFANLASRNDIQVFITSHSPAFYLAQAEDRSCSICRHFVVGRAPRKEPVEGDERVEVPGNAVVPINTSDEAEHQMNEAGLFQLPYLISHLSKLNESAAETLERYETLRRRLDDEERPVLFVEGDCDALLFHKVLSNMDGGIGDSLAIHTLGGTPTKTPELLKKIVSSGRNLAKGGAFFLFDNDKAGRSAFRYLSEQAPKPGIHWIGDKIATMILPISEQFGEFKNEFELRDDQIFYPAEFLLDGPRSAELFAELLDEDEQTSYSNRVYEFYFSGLPQKTVFALKDTKPPSPYWLWARGVPDNKKKLFTKLAIERLDLEPLVPVAEEIMNWLNQMEAHV